MSTAIPLVACFLLAAPLSGCQVADDVIRRIPRAPAPIPKIPAPGLAAPDIVTTIPGSPTPAQVELVSIAAAEHADAIRTAQPAAIESARELWNDPAIQPVYAAACEITIDTAIDGPPEDAAGLFEMLGGAVAARNPASALVLDAVAVENGIEAVQQEKYAAAARVFLVLAFQKVYC